MSNTILIKRSGTANAVPSSANLALGELAINYTDGNLFYKNGAGDTTLLVSNKFVSVTGNVTGGNVNTAGVVTATGNITGGNLVTSGLTSIAGNVTGGNVNTAGLITATGNITGGNLVTSGLTSIAGNITGGNVNTAGLITATGNIAGNYFIGNGSQLTGITVAAGTSITNGTSNVVVAASGNITANVAGNLITTFADTGQFVNGLISATGNITGGNVSTAGLITATGNITGGNVSTAGLVSASGNVTGNYILGNGALLTGVITSVANINNGTSNVTVVGSGGNVTVSVGGTSNVAVFATTGEYINGLLSVSGNVTGGNINGGANVFATTHTGSTVSVTGNITGGNILAPVGLIDASAYGTIISTGNVSGTNVNTGGLISATGNVTGGNITTAGLISATGNVTGGNVLTAGLISATGNVTGGNITTAGLVSSSTVSATGNVTGGNVNTATVNSSGALSITSGSNGNISIQPNGAGNIVLANTYINSVRYPVQDQDAATKIYVDNLVSTAISYHEAVFAATTTTLATATSGTVTYAQPNGAGNGVGATLTTTGAFNLIDTANVQTANTRILVKDEANAAHNGVYVWSNVSAITRSSDTDIYGVGNAFLLGINDYFFTTSGNVNKGTAFVVDAPSGVITFGTSNIEFAVFSQSQVYSANTSAGLILNGTQFSAKVDNNTTAFDGGGNIIVKASANLTTPNIGAATGTSLSVTGTIAGTGLTDGGAGVLNVNSTVDGGTY